jgi:hypothetical protein
MLVQSQWFDGAVGIRKGEVGVIERCIVSVHNGVVIRAEEDEVGDVIVTPTTAPDEMMNVARVMSVRVSGIIFTDLATPVVVVAENGGVTPNDAGARTSEFVGDVIGAWVTIG